MKKVREEEWTDHGAQPKALQIDCSGSWQQIVRSFSVFSLILGNLSKVLVVGVHNPNERVQNLLNLPTNPEISLPVLSFSVLIFLLLHLDFRARVELSSRKLLVATG